MMATWQHHAEARRIEVMQSLRISVIMPVLDEAARIGRQLQELLEVEGLDEILVVDGGSTDGTQQIVRSFAEVSLLVGPPGRGRQMNLGAQAAKGEVLLFLHADVSLPPDAAAWIRRSLTDPAVAGGAFRTWHVPEANMPRAWLGPLLHLADLRSRYSGLPYGDQALFVRTRVFHALGGFREQDLMEDLEFSRRMRQAGKIVTVPSSVLVSGRRFQARPVYYLVADRVFPLLYRLGVSGSKLAAWYGNPREGGGSKSPSVGSQ